MKKTFAIFFAMIMLSFSYSSIAAEPKLTRSHNTFTQGLNLDSAQRVKFEAIKAHTEKNLKSIGVNSVSNNVVSKKIESEQADDKAVKQYLDEVGKARAQAQAHYYRYQYSFEANQELTTHQKEKLINIIKKYDLY